MLVGCIHALGTMGNTKHGSTGCLATIPSQSKHEKEKTSLPDFFWLFLL
jgi:hypothetical protein